MKKITLFLLTVCLLLISGCNEAPKTREVPEALIKSYAEESEYYNPNYDCSIKTAQEWDAETNRAHVGITLIVNGDYGKMSVNGFAVFEYDKNSDLWSIVKEGSWGEPWFSFNSNLCKDWLIENYNSKYSVKVTSVNEGEINAECRISEYVQSYSETGYCDVKVSSSCLLEDDCWIKIPFDLPNGFYVSWHDTASGENEYVSELRLKFDIYEGICDAYVYPTVRLK